MRGVRLLRRTWERLGVLRPAIILAYHRVADLDADPQLLAVTPQHFAEHLAVLRRDCHPVSLRELRQGLRRHCWRPRTVVLTFDDGYADNLYHAKPLLEAADVPATVFVTAGKVDDEHEFWWDALESVLLTGEPLPTELELPIPGRVSSWCLPPDQERPDVKPTWNVLMNQVRPTPRQALYLELAAVLTELDHDAREALLEQLFHWAGRVRVARPTHRALRASELCALTQDGLVEVGAHTMTHPVLSGLPVNLQQAEIRTSKQALEERLETPVTSFAYPFGGRAHYERGTVQLVKAAGFTCACSNFEGHAAFYTDPYQLPRYLVRDWDGDAFAKHLEDWFAAR